MTRSVLLVGNFDGLHLGHQRLLEEARRLASPHDARVVVVTFLEHPATVLRPDRAPPTVLHRDQREAALRAFGADRIEWLDPRDGVLQLTPERFIESLVERHRPLAMVEGVNFRFGRKRAGDTETLRDLGRAMGFDVLALDLELVALRDKTLAPVSSSLIRWLIGHGRLADVALCLDRPWPLRGVVGRGERRGRTLDAPTANLDTAPQMLPADGVYAGLATIEPEPGGAAAAEPDRRLAAISVGPRPTFDRPERTCEVFLLDYEGDLYGRTLTVEPTRWLRDQRRFPDAEALKRQIGRDVGWVHQLARHDMLDPAALSIDPQHRAGWEV